MHEFLQDTFFQEAVENKTRINIITMNGFQIECILVAYDRFVLKIQACDGVKLMYKHAISTIEIKEKKQKLE